MLLVQTLLLLVETALAARQLIDLGFVLLPRRLGMPLLLDAFLRARLEFLNAALELLLFLTKLVGPLLKLEGRLLLILLNLELARLELRAQPLDFFLVFAGKTIGLRGQLSADQLKLRCKAEL